MKHFILVEITHDEYVANTMLAYARKAIHEAADPNSSLWIKGNIKDVAIRGDRFRDTYTEAEQLAEKVFTSL